MSLSSAFRQSWKQRKPRRTSHACEATRSRFETLEDRCLLSLTPTASYPVSLDPAAIVAADFNNDGAFDLAVANTYSDNVSVLLGGANGTFGAAISSHAGDRPTSVAVGDFDDDGNLDLAVVSRELYPDPHERSKVRVMFGAGDGRFEAPRYFAVLKSDPQLVAAGDFNGDGATDLVVAENDYTFAESVGVFGQVSVLLSNGDRTFGAPSYAGELAINPIYSIAVADFNADGDQDLVVGEIGYWVEVALGDGAGRFVSNFPQIFEMRHGPALAVGDVNGDGDPDVAAANNANVTVRLGNGDAGFEPPRGGYSYAVGDKSLSVVLGDFDRDGRLDVATANYDSNDVSILRGRGDGTFVAAVDFAIPPGRATDFDGTGTIDGSDLGQWRGDFAANADSDADADGDSDGGDFLAWQRQLGARPDDVGPIALAAADFNGDGWLDLATANAEANSASILINDQSWTPLPPTVVVNVDKVTKLEGTSGTTTPFTFTVTLSAPSAATVSMSYGLTFGPTYWGYVDPQPDDYVLQTGALAFVPGETTKTITIEVTADDDVERDEYFYLALFDDGSHALRISVFGLGAILNDD